jgi:predicted anti-sigma-YlaC factor YlaD
MIRPHTIWHLLNLPCRGVTRLASESLDRDLAPLESLTVRAHLLYCRACRRYVRQIRLLRAAFRRLATCDDAGHAGPSLPDDVRERIKDALRDC